MQKKYTLNDLISIIQTLRSENGCPWDQQQTHETLKEAMVEEAFEAVDAIEQQDMNHLKEELGDVLLQVVLHCQIEQEKQGFSMEDVITNICEKMIYRHPHVFGDTKLTTSEEVLSNWEELKKKEKNFSTQTQSMNAIASTLPALTRAKKVQKKAADVGFDFYETGGTIEKVLEECEELKEAISLNLDTIEEEYGDILFATVNISRFLKINPEFALTKATKKFINRFEYIESSVLLEKKHLCDMTLGELDLLWNEAKTKVSFDGSRKK